MRRSRWMFAAGLVLMVAGAARAENLEEFGLGARAQGMGMAFTGLASDGTAAYYNPGGLIFSRHLNLSLGFSYGTHFLEFDSAAGGAFDNDAERIPDLSALSLGVSTTIPVDVPDRLGFGLALFLPTRGVIDLEARAVSNAPEWFSYGERHNRLVLVPALALKIVDGLSLGLGASLVLDAAGGTTITGGLTTPTEAKIELELEPDAGVVAGIMFAPADWISFGLAFRSELALDLEFPANVVLQGVQLPLGLETTTFFSPNQLWLGAAVNATDDLLFTLDLGWVQWSAYDPVFLDVTSGVVAVIPPSDVDLKDVFHVRLGAELLTTDWLLLRGGYAYRTSAVPDQTSEPTNLADSAKHTITFGVGFVFGQPPEELSEEAQESEGRAQTMEEALIDASFDLDLFVQYHIHPQVSANKAAGDPIGPWDAGGAVLNLGFTLTARF